MSRLIDPDKTLEDEWEDFEPDFEPESSKPEDMTSTAAKILSSSTDFDEELPF